MRCIGRGAGFNPSGQQEGRMVQQGLSLGPGMLAAWHDKILGLAYRDHGATNPSPRASSLRHVLSSLHGSLTPSHRLNCGGTATGSSSVKSSGSISAKGMVKACFRVRFIVRLVLDFAHGEGRCSHRIRTPNSSCSNSMNSHADYPSGHQLGAKVHWVTP